MHNIAIFCKSYIGDFEQFKILKNSVDLYNEDKLPFYISVPKKDLLTMQTVINGNETYEIVFITDEEILAQEEDFAQSWIAQQVIKLSLHKLKKAQFYAVIDSDTYFIQSFYKKDFMYNDETPYTVMRHMPPRSPKNSPQNIIKDYFKREREGMTYNWCAMPVIMSSFVLEKFEEYRKNNNLTIHDLLKIAPYEFCWYGEFLYKIKPFEIVPIENWAFNRCHSDWAYFDSRKYLTLEDIIHQGYLCIVMQSGWVKDNIYKPHLFYKYYKWRKNIFDKRHRRGRKSFIAKLKTSVLKLISCFIPSKQLRKKIRSM